jgi:hypothetical protein
MWNIGLVGKEAAKAQRFLTLPHPRTTSHLQTICEKQVVNPVAQLPVNATVAKTSVGNSSPAKP